MNAELDSGIELHLGTESHSEAELQRHAKAKLQNEEDAHSDSKVSTHGRNVETYEWDVHSDTERQIARPNAEPTLSKYVRRHHPESQIIGDRNARHMTRSRLRSKTCLVSMKEPKIVKEALEDDNWYKAMEEEI